MKLKIGDLEQELNFGVRFVNELDHVAGISQAGLELGMGLTKMLPGLRSYDPSVLADVIYSACYDNSPRVGKEAIYNYLDDPKTDIEKTFDAISKEMNKANALKAALKNMKA